MDIPLLLSAVTLQPFAVANIFIFIVIILLLCASSFASSSESAFFSLTPQNLNDMESADTPADRRVFALLEKSEYLLATILITNNFVNVAIVMLCALLIDKIFIFEPWLEFLVETIIITFLLLLFGEIMPKVYAQQDAVKVSRRVSRALTFLCKVCKPFAFLLVKSTKSVNRLARPRHDNLTIDEMNEAIDLTTSNKGIDEEKDILKGIVNFGNTSVDGVMTTRLDMITVNTKMTYSEVLHIVEEYGYSRIPVVNNSQDDIRGILYIKDLLPHLGKSDTFKWQTLVKPAYFVPETKKIDDLLREFQKNKIHVAIVVDEFGGTLGMVTMEDILEEIVGDISDEYDDEVKLYTKIDDKTFVFEAKIPLNDFFKATEIGPDTFGHNTEEADTLAGLLLELKGDFPVKGEKITFGRYTFEITALGKHRIQRVKMVVGDEPKTDEE